MKGKEWVSVGLKKYPIRIDWRIVQVEEVPDHDLGSSTGVALTSVDACLLCP